jgi:hypothetical protein
MQLICEKLFFFSESYKASSNVYTEFFFSTFFYFLQSLKIGLQLNVEKRFLMEQAGVPSQFLNSCSYFQNKFKKKELQFSNLNKHEMIKTLKKKMVCFLRSMKLNDKFTKYRFRAHQDG